jgi:hypothetical protein
MARTPTQKKKRTDACAEYAGLGFDTTCEVITLLRKCPDANAWINRHIESSSAWSYKLEIHHIWGKKTWQEPECNQFCSLVRLWKCCHDYDAVKPRSLEICCIAAKLARHQRWLDSEGEIFGRKISDVPIEKRHWVPESMGRICGAETLAGRIEAMLMPELSEPLKLIAVEILMELNSEGPR